MHHVLARVLHKTCLFDISKRGRRYSGKEIPASHRLPQSGPASLLKRPDSMMCPSAAAMLEKGKGSLDNLDLIWLEATNDESQGALRIIGKFMLDQMTSNQQFLQSHNQGSSACRMQFPTEVPTQERRGNWWRRCAGQRVSWSEEKIHTLMQIVDKPR